MRASTSRSAAKVKAFRACLADSNLLAGPEIEAIANIAAIDHLPASFQTRGHARSLALRLAKSLALPFSGSLALALTFRWQMACLAKGLLLLLPILPNTSGRRVVISTGRRT